MTRATWTSPSSVPHFCYWVIFPLWWWRVVTWGDSGYLDTAKLTASLLLSGLLPSVGMKGSDPG